MEELLESQTASQSPLTQNFTTNLQNETTPPDLNSFLGKLGGMNALLATTSLPIPTEEKNEYNNFDKNRANLGYKIRVQAAQQQKVITTQTNNGDELRYHNKIGNYSKGLPHNSFGEVQLSAYNSMLQALESVKPYDFEQIPLGSPPQYRRKLVAPIAALDSDLENGYTAAIEIPPAPALCSAHAAAEIIENYWMALCRDIPFNQYKHSKSTLNASAELSDLEQFDGPKIGAQVTPDTLFRLELPHTLEGPYISQFLWKIPPFGATYVEPTILTALPSINYLTYYNDWLNSQNGLPPLQTIQYDPQRRYIRNGRDLSMWVHIDKHFESYFNALLITLEQPSNNIYTRGIGAPYNAGGPHNDLRHQTELGTPGREHFFSMVEEVASKALRAQWFQKWNVHRRLRPEAYSGLVHLRKKFSVPYPLHNQVLESEALKQTYLSSGSYLLPQCYPEGSPLHPSYGAGQATVAGACVTMLKAWFDENFIIPDPVIVNDDGLAVSPYNGPALTLGGELNKLAANIALGRNIAGVHWRTDALTSLYLGESIAIRIMQNHELTLNNTFRGLTFTKFDGSLVTI